MSGEPLGRTKTHGSGSGAWSTVEIDIYAPPGTEVEVWRAGDRPVPPTRQQVFDLLWTELGPLGRATHRPNYGDVNDATDAVMALFSGVPTEPEVGAS